MTPKTALLLNDVFGNKAPTKGAAFPKYGSKGEKVLIISFHDEVVIVEGKKGRFSTRIENLKFNGE